MSRRSEGFTLIEVVVALAIFSLAALALLRLQGATVVQTAALADRGVGQIVARNLMVDAMTDNRPLTIGETAGQVTNAGRTWQWTRSIKRTDDLRILRVDVIVRDALGRPSASLSFARPLE